ncbi:hypothetical protein ACLKA7_009149 [Drosophila subpalustris]
MSNGINEQTRQIGSWGSGESGDFTCCLEKCHRLCPVELKCKWIALCYPDGALGGSINGEYCSEKRLRYLELNGRPSMKRPQALRLSLRAHMSPSPLPPFTPAQQAQTHQASG